MGNRSRSLAGLSLPTCQGGAGGADQPRYHRCNSLWASGLGIMAPCLRSSMCVGLLRPPPLPRLRRRPPLAGLARPLRRSPPWHSGHELFFQHPVRFAHRWHPSSDLRRGPPPLRTDGPHSLTTTALRCWRLWSPTCAPARRWGHTHRGAALGSASTIVGGALPVTHGRSPLTASLPLRHR